MGNFFYELVLPDGIYLAKGSEILTWLITAICYRRGYISAVKKFNITKLKSFKEYSSILRDGLIDLISTILTLVSFLYNKKNYYIFS